MDSLWQTVGGLDHIPDDSQTVLVFPMSSVPSEQLKVHVELKLKLPRG